MRLLDRIIPASKYLMSGIMPNSSHSLQSGISLQEASDGQRQFDSFMRNVPLPVKKWWGALGLSHNFKPNQSLGKFGSNVWLYGGVSLISQEIGRTKFHLYKENEETGEQEIIRRHQALATLKRPIQKDGGRAHLTGMKLKMILAQHLLLNGEAFWVMDDRSPITGSPRMVFPLIPGGVQVKLNKDNLIDKYIYRTPQREYEFDAADVVHFSLPDPEDFYRGHSPLQSAWWALETHQKADELNYFKMENRAIPAGLLTSDKAIPEKERQKLLNQFLGLFKGTENAEKTGILPYGLGFERVSETNAEMQYSEGKDKNRDEILANMRVGLEMLGKTEAQTRANAEASNYVFQRFNILGFMELIADTLTHDFLPVFSGSEGLNFGFPDPVPENMEEKRATAQLLLAEGAVSIDEARAMFGFPALDIAGWSDVPLVPISKAPLGEEPLPSDTEGDDGEDDVDEKPEDDEEDTDEEDTEEDDK